MLPSKGACTSPTISACTSPFSLIGRKRFERIRIHHGSNPIYLYHVGSSILLLCALEWGASHVWLSGTPPNDPSREIGGRGLNLCPQESTSGWSQLGSEQEPSLTHAHPLALDQKRLKTWGVTAGDESSLYTDHNAEEKQQNKTRDLLNFAEQVFIWNRETGEPSHLHSQNVL